jgi:hypothetical protein
MFKTITLYLLLFSLNFYCQNTIFIGNSSYEGTKRMFFSSDGDQFDFSKKDATIQFGKKGENYILYISTKVFNASESLTGSIQLYLSDGSTLKLSKKINKDYVNQTSVAIFSISISEIKKLKNSDIVNIRFNTAIQYGDMEGHSVSNYIYRQEPSRNGGYHYAKETWYTSQEINKL